MTRILCFLAVVAVLGGSSAQAANQYYMPGDAFFSAVLTEDVLDRIAKEEHPVFDYDRPEFLPRMLCGYAGFSRLKFVKMPKEMKENLRKSYAELRKDYPKQIEIRPETRTKRTKDEGDIEVPTGRDLHIEINGFRVLFYNADFDMKKHRLCLKYNEQWADEFAAWGHKRSSAQLETFVPTPEAIVTDWRDGALVDPLSVTLPDRSPKNIRVPIQVKKGVIAIVIPVNDFERIYRGEENAWGRNLVIHAVSASGIKRLHASRGHWSESAEGGFGTAPLGGLGTGPFGGIEKEVNKQRKKPKKDE
ncbi:MAG: hypothetical protein H8E37_03960 [Planctomycetes bacterium]|nr:hypothetical protein [Planctomycetota bacterium]